MKPVEAERTYGYTDPVLVTASNKWSFRSSLSLGLALLFIVAVWFALDQKLLLGSNWISETYDNEEWRTNEGNLHTYGAWDFEAHVWKTEWIMQHFPNFNWNPYWYLGMPVIKYYQPGFYAVHALFIAFTGLNAARAALLLVLLSHLAAAIVTFVLCYKVSQRIWVSALCSTFVLSNTFLSLRSYGWEPITVVFLFLYPLGLLIFLREPLRPFRFWMIAVLAAAYLSHPLLFFSLAMTMGIYLFSIAVRHSAPKDAQHRHYIWQYLAAIGCSLLIGAVQLIPQLTYQQATSGAHMGMKYLPYYQVPFNIITLKDFFLDAANLKGPGPIIMIAFSLLVMFGVYQYLQHRSERYSNLYLKKVMVTNHELIAGMTLVLLMMVLFYYTELYNIFPMNLLRSIQYHRIIPEFIIAAAVLVAAMSNITYSYWSKVTYYSMLVAFVLASGIVIWIVQGYWQTAEDISQKPEFIYDRVPGRISFPYTDQSLAVRSSFRFIPQTYGYYEQGITNSYADELFSVSSGYHNADLTVLYLKAANVGRLYVNTEEGDRDKIMRARLNTTLPYNREKGERYAYFEVPLADAEFTQAVDGNAADEAQALKPGCREIFKETYCGSIGEEFVSTDKQETDYLRAYTAMLEQPYSANADISMLDPDHYLVNVAGANQATAVVIKMTHDREFRAYLDGKELPIETIGPDFMLVKPGKEGAYELELVYKPRTALIGLLLSTLSFAILSLAFALRNFFGVRVPLPSPQASRGTATASKSIVFPRGDMR
ncbi:hypothetical protein HYV81_06425 [Candidatus Woesearchaeota archaeon]|nr:hypothetical protein [Candidatus Woesearchaeota archaeon]